MDSTPLSGSTKAVVISGIHVQLSKSLKDSLLIKLSISGGDPRSVLLERGEKPIGDHHFQEPLKLREGSILSVQIQEKHRIRPNKNLAQLNLSLDKLWAFQVHSEPEGNLKKYLVELPDPEQQIWLNVSMVPSSSPTQTWQVDVPDDVSRNQRATKALENATKSLEDFKTTFDRLGGSKLEKGINIAEAFGELHPIAGLVIKLVRIVHDEVKAQDQHHKELLDLAESMERTLKFIPTAEAVAKLNVLKDTIRSFYELMDKTVDFVKKWVEGGGISQVINVSDSQTEIEGLTKRYKALEIAFDRGVMIDGVAKIDYVAKSQELEELKARLGGITDVQPRASSCMEGTRVDILTNVEHEINHLESNNIIWIHGAPGSGKSAVSLTLKLRLHKQRRLVTYFRFDRNESAITTSGALWRRVAYDLADRYSSKRESMLSVLGNNQVDLTSTMDLFKSLIEEPLTEFTDPPPTPPLIIVIDALDECGGLAGSSSLDRKVLLQTLARWPRLPKYIKLLVTSRREGDITRALSSISTPIEILSGHFLTENPEAKATIDASNDIRMYLEERLRAIRENFPSLRPDWPGTETITAMVSRAAGIFMWATTAANFIDCKGIDPEERLGKIMDDNPESMESLYSLYKAILETAFGHIIIGGSEAELLRSILGTAVLAKRPFEDIEYAKLPTTNPVTVLRIDSIRDGLRSVVAPGALRFIHKSFDDFLLSDKCPPKYAVNPDETQHLLAKLCLTTMTAGLRFNICDLKTSCLKNEDVPEIETKVRDGISSLLSYSCCFWTDHLARSPFDAQLLEAIKDVIFDKLLYWFEAMSLLKETIQIPHSLLSLLNWVKPASDEELDDFIRDAHRFIGAFGQPISKSAPHVYISALPFSPERSAVARQFLSRFPKILKVSVGKTADWSRCIFTSVYHVSWVDSVAFSPDARYFVFGSGKHTFCIFDSETGNLISGPFRGADNIISCFFSPDGRRVWAHYWAGKVIGWDVETGDKDVEFQVGGGDGTVIGCSCSNNGQNIISAIRQGTVTLWSADDGEQLGEVLKLPRTELVSFSPDCRYVAGAERGATKIRIWRLEDGSEIQGQHHSLPRTKPISALSFSIDGPFVVSGSKDGVILIWDAKTGDVIDRPLVTGKGYVAGVVYSHEKEVLVASFIGTLMIWNTSTHEAVLSFLEGEGSYYIALSRDGQRALSVSDSTVRMWDLGMGVVSATGDIDGQGQVWDVAFSPCGKRLASLDCGTIRVWDASTGQSLLNPIINVSYSHLIFSPDGSQILVFNSGDGTIEAWDVKTGDLVFEHDMSDDGYEKTCILHVAFRSTDQRLVTCSDNGIVRIWSLENGSLTEDVAASSPQPEGPKSLEIVALSPDGLTAIVRDHNRTPRHYQWSTTTCQPLPLTFIDDKYIPGYRSTYSPTGKFFAVISNGDTLRVWNTQTGEFAAGPSTFTEELLALAFSPDDCHIALSYRSPNTDGISIWNTLTGNWALRHRKAHAVTVWQLAFSLDGKTLSSGSEGGQIGIWAMDDLLGDTQPSAGFLGVGTHMHDGWVTDPAGQLLFWVPYDQRSTLVWPSNTGIMINPHGMRTELDLTRFTYGLEWEGCCVDRK